MSYHRISDGDNWNGDVVLLVVVAALLLLVQYAVTR